MTRVRIALTGFLIGCIAKGGLLAVYYLAHPEWAFRWIVGYDPLVAISADWVDWVAGRVSLLVCSDSHFINCSEAVFDGWIVTAFGLECAGAALLVQVLLAVRRGMADPTRRR